MYAVVKRSLGMSDLHEAGIADPKYLYAREVLYVYEGELGRYLPGNLIALSEYGTKEGPYFLYPRDNVELED